MPARWPAYDAGMIETITLRPGFTFDLLTDGPADAPLVLLLHGFAESFHTWRAHVEKLAKAGYRAVAPSQRGYCASARPDTADPANYEFDKLVGDAMDIAERCGQPGRRFHLVGHDWGGSIAWGIADKYPERLASLAVLSRPHPVAFNKALALPDGEQARRSSHHRWFLEADAVARLLADDSRWLRERLKANKVPLDSIARHVAFLGNAATMEAALAWYRARGAIRAPLGTIRVPTLAIWGDADDTVGRVAAEGTVDCVSAPYRFEALPGGGHFVHEQMPERVNALLLAHLKAHPA
jgi:pimeloyl-ACP methyl ester carboxylesterase